MSYNVARERISKLSGYGWAVAGVVAATALFWIFRHSLDPGQASLLYMPVVIGCAARFGFGPAVGGAFLSFLSWDFFFLPPYYKFTVYSSRDIVSLCVFMVAALVTARLAAQVREQATNAIARERETLTLYEASRVISEVVEVDRLLNALAEQVVKTCGSKRCLVFRPGESGFGARIAAVAGEEPLTAADTATIRNIAQNVMDQNSACGLQGERTPSERNCLGISDERQDEPGRSPGMFLPLFVHGNLAGVLHVGQQRDRRGYTDQEKRLIMTIANHAAVVIARQELAEIAQYQARQTAILDERNRLAEEVHDTMSHSFTGIKFLLEAAERIGPGEKAIECISKAKELAVEGAAEARRSVWAMRPTGLEETGDLVGAIRALADRSMTISGLSVEVEATGDPAPLGADVEENLLRLCQEALTNVLRHANAERTHIGLIFEPDHLVLSVKDDGVGIDPESAASSDGFGLKNMRARAARIGGVLTIQNEKGAEIKVVAPLNRNPDPRC